MATNERLLVSGGCIIEPPERKVGFIKPVPIPGAAEVLFQAKSRFASDIYIVLDSDFLRSYGRESLADMRYFCERKGDLDIVGWDRVIALDGKSCSLMKLVDDIRFTHAVMEDVLALRSLREKIQNRFYFSRSPHCDDPTVICTSAWEALSEELLR